jgi:aminoglycoside phosphotransferase (APT) family kinase protein
MDLILGMRSAWSSPSIPSADQLAQRYSELSGRPLAHWPFHMSLAYFKIAIIAAGIDFRRRMAGGADGPDRVGEVIAPLIASGLKAINSPE